MRTAKQIRLVAAAVSALFAANVARAADQQAVRQSEGTAAAPASARREIVVSLEDRKLALLQDGKVEKIYPVAVGKPSTPSPVGSFTIERRVANPTYHHDGRTIPPGPNNPVGTRWMGLSIKGYGIHGTNEPKSIGKAASHGCIRLAKADLEDLYPMIQVGDQVEIIGHRDEETAQLFGDGVSPIPQGQLVLAQDTPAAATPAASAQSTPAAATQENTSSQSASAKAAALAVFTGAL
jgi:lipoprotein-anchoring transpeptidase ErfK/SrfK